LKRPTIRENRVDAVAGEDLKDPVALAITEQVIPLGGVSDIGFD
jgi:hypothetical protein